MEEEDDLISPQLLFIILIGFPSIAQNSIVKSCMQDSEHAQAPLLFLAVAMELRRRNVSRELDRL
jgi:hypothetical protein